MNKSDFISDAVALDLGKSGVKVAETLEIEADGEWWRLINSSKSTSLPVFDHREEAPPLTSDGVIDVSGMSKIRVTENATNKDVYTPMFTALFANGDEVFIYCSSRGIYPSNTSYSLLKIRGINKTQNVTWTKEYVIEKNDKCYPIYFDPIINAIVITYRFNYSGSRRYAVLVNSVGTTLESPYIATTAIASTDFFKTFSLPEGQGKVYSMFWTSGGAMKIKTVAHAVGDNQASKSVTLSSNSSAVTLSLVPSTALFSAGAYMFYLRQAESVGIAFLDSADSRIKYILESENWGTLHIVADIGEGNTQLDGFGTITTPLDGEFFMAHFREEQTGNLGKPAGYSFPANMVINGFTRTGEKNFRMFGSVASTLYAYTLDPDTMSLTYDGIVTENWTGGNGKPVMLEHSGSLELISFGDVNQKLILYDGSTKTMVWLWSDWGATLFPVYNESATTRMSNICCCSSQPLMFFVTYKNSSNFGKVETYTIPSSLFFSCSTTAEVSALFTVARHGTYTNPDAPNHDPMMRVQSAEASLMMIENETHYIFPFCEYNNSNNSWFMTVFVGISKADVTQVTRISYVTLTGNNTTERDSVFSIAPQKQLTRHKYEQSTIVDDSTKDGLTRITNGYGIRYMSPTGSIIAGPIASLGATSKYDETIENNPNWRHYAVTCNDKGIGMFIAGKYRTTADTIRMTGAYYDGANIAGQTNALTTSMLVDNIALDSWNDVAIITGAISGGEIPYVKIGARSWNSKYVRALSVRDGAVYNMDAGSPILGGARYFYPCGSTMFWISNTGYAEAMSTGATWTAGMGAEGSMEEVSPIIVRYKENTYIPYPFAREGIKVELSNISKTTKVTIPETQTDLIRTMIAGGTDFRGSRCILRRLFPDHTEEGSDIILLDGYIQDWSYSPDKKGILFTVSKTLIDVGATFPKRLMNMGCSHVFKGVRCGYLGADGICTKTKTDCTAKGSVNNFGGFPWVAARQRRIMWR